MPFPLIAAGIAAGASLLGGAKSAKENRKALRESEALQREFAQHGVRWRVEDAKAAGVHPLYALGAQLPAASPIVVPDSMGPAIADAGQNIASGIVARSSRPERMMAQLQLKIAEQQLREGDARINLLNAEAALAHQNAMAAKGFPEVNASEGSVMAVDADKKNPMVGMVTPVAADLPGTDADDPSRIAGDPAMWRKFKLGNMEMVLPGGVTGDASESLESVTESIPAMWMVIRENVRRFGMPWLYEFMDTYGFEGLGDVFEGIYEYPNRMRQLVSPGDWLPRALESVSDPMMPRGWQGR